MFKPKSIITCSYDATVFEATSKRIWIPTNQDAVKIGVDIDEAPQGDNIPCFRISANAVGEPLVLSGFKLAARHYSPANAAFYQFLSGKRTPIADELSNILYNYIGYPIVMDAFREAISAGTTAENTLEDGIKNALTATGKLELSMWLGEPVNSRREQFYLVDFNGDNIVAKDGVIDAITNDWVISSENNPRMIGSTNFVSQFRVLNKTGRIDSDGFTQPRTILGNAGQSGSIAQGTIQTRTGIDISSGGLNYDTDFNFTIQSSEVYPSVAEFDFNRDRVVSVSRHTISGFIQDRYRAGLGETPLNLGSPSVQGLFEIPKDSGHTYNLIQLREFENNNLFCVFQTAD